MGTVFRGLDTETGSAVAIKRLRPETTLRDPRSVERFRREGEALSRLNHPNIVKLLATAVEDGAHYLVMNLVAGGSLEDLLGSGAGTFTVDRALRVGLSIADALACAHEVGIVHRDVKPSNVLVTGDDGTPQLSDFGVAHLAGAERLSAPDGIVGTLDYVSPETLKGEDLDGRADVWGLGVLMFEILTGIRPFAAAHAAATLQAVLSAPPPDLEAMRPDCPSALVDLVYRMLEKDKAQRIMSARLVSEELSRIIAGGPTFSSPRVTAPDRVQPAEPTVPDLTPSVNVGAALMFSPATPFVGRGEELAELAELFRDAEVRLVTIVGPGGMGKSRLAMEAARMMAERRGVFEDTIPRQPAPACRSSSSPRSTRPISWRPPSRRRWACPSTQAVSRGLSCTLTCVIDTCCLC
jgi:serine/threonine-protein kinase